jgi:hypothetical protein
MHSLVWGPESLERAAGRPGIEPQQVRVLAELKKAFLTHRDQTEQHVERLQEMSS